MKLFVPKTNSAGPMNFQKKRCLGRIGGGNIKHLCVPAANLNYNSFQSESDKNGLLVQIAIVHIPQSDQSSPELPRAPQPTVQAVTT